MSIANEITRLQNAKADIKSSIENKGVTVPSSAKLDGYSDYIDAIQGGGSAVIQSLTVTDNGTYTAPSGVDGYSPVTVNVSGGGGGSAEKKQINFIDYDGTILHSYTKAEIEAMTAESDLPANPSHSGLVAQGWNWTLAQIKSQLTSAPTGDVWVGQMYITESGDTEIDIELLDSARLSPYLNYAVNGTATIDWGDGSEVSTVTGTSLTSRKSKQHAYATTGKYTIKIHVQSGTASLFSSNTYTLLNAGSSTAAVNSVYGNCVKNIRIGTKMGLGNYSLYNCYALASLTIPSGVTSIGTNAFQNCYSLASITMPSGVTSIGVNAFASLYSFVSVAVPNSITSIQNNTFSTCYILGSITIPNSVTDIGNSPFLNCYSLASLTIPSGVISIGSNAFQNCRGLTKFYIKRTTPPTLGTNSFSGVPTDCIMYVPSESLEAYQTASNWSTYASRMQGE